MATISGAGGGGKPSKYGARPTPEEMQPSVRPYTPPDTSVRTKPINPNEKPVGAALFGRQKLYKTTPTKAVPEADVLWHNAEQAIGPDVVKRASNPRVAALHDVLGALTGIPSTVDALEHRQIAKAGIGVAGLFPFGRAAKAVEEAAIAARAVKDAGETAKVVRAAEVPTRVYPKGTHPLLAAKPTVQRGPAPTAQTLQESVLSGLSGARTARAQEEALRRPERAARIEAYGKALQENPTAAGAKAARAHLAGEYPKVKFGAFEHFTPEAHDAMVKFINDHPNLGEWEPVRATKALEKLRSGVKPQRAEEALLRKIFGPEVTKDLMLSVSSFRRLKALGYDVLNSPRAVMASADASGLGRQSLLVATGHPRLWAKNVPEYLGAMKSQEKYDTGMDALHQHPLITSGRAEQMGLDLTEMSARGERAGVREEPFRSTFAEKLPFVKASGRGYVYGLNNSRLNLAQLIDNKAHALEGKMVPRIRWIDGRMRIVREPIDPNDPALIESIGRFVNSANGRGDLGNGVIGSSQEGLNLLMFSPRLIKSRVDFLNPFWYAKLHPLVRHEAYRAMAGLVGLVSLALTLAHEAGVPIPLDPRRSDFGKINSGHIHVDLSGGFFQYTRILAEIATQQKVSTKGEVSNLGGGYGKTSDLSLVLDFLRRKLAPVTSGVVDVADQKNAIGQPLTWQNSVVSRVVPLSGQDAWAVGKDIANKTGSVPGGAGAGALAFLLSGVGGGVQDYTPKTPSSSGGSGRSGGYGSRRGSGGSSYGRRSGGSGSSYGARP